MIEIYLMLKDIVSAKQLQTIVEDNFEQIETDIWSEANIMELELSDKTTIDFVSIDNFEMNDEDKFYFEQNNFKSIYCISYDKEDETILIKALKLILNKYDGVVGNDTDNFEPIFDKSNIDNLTDIE